MTNHALRVASKNTIGKRSIGWLGGIVVAWVAIVLTLAVGGAFDVPAEEPVWAMLLALIIPIALFGAAMILSPRLRELALSLDPVLLTEFQAWRILGGLFLAVYAFGHLPGVFAWPAGLGDIAVGLSAPFAAWNLKALAFDEARRMMEGTPGKACSSAY